MKDELTVKWKGVKNAGWRGKKRTARGKSNRQKHKQSERPTKDLAASRVATRPSFAQSSDSLSPGAGDSEARLPSTQHHQTLTTQNRCSLLLYLLSASPTKLAPHRPRGYHTHLSTVWYPVWHRAARLLRLLLTSETSGHSSHRLWHRS